MKGKGFVKVMFFLLGWLMKKSGCKAVDNELNNLKRLLELRSGTTVPGPADRSLKASGS